MPLKLLSVIPSTRKDKRLTAVFSDGTKTHFGAHGGSTYLDHRSTAKRAAYLARHGAGGEDWTDPKRAGTLARFILWGEHTSLTDAVTAYKKRFGL